MLLTKVVRYASVMKKSPCSHYGRITCGFFNWGMQNLLDFYMKADLDEISSIFCEMEEWQAFKNQGNSVFKDKF